MLAKEIKEKDPKVRSEDAFEIFSNIKNIFVNIPLVFVFRVNYTNTPKVWKNQTQYTQFPRNDMALCSKKILESWLEKRYPPK